MDNKPETIDLTETKIAKDSGEVRIAFKLSPEHYETLKVLNDSPHYKFYRQLLLQCKDAHVASMLQMDDPHKVMKAVGMVAGINLAINQLPVLCAEYARAQKEALAKKEKKDVPFQRG